MAGRPRTVRDHIAWAYANLARAHAALDDGVQVYSTKHHVIWNRTYSGLTSGTIAIRSLYHDERLKMFVPQACCYCGSREALCADHLIPRVEGGPDDADNLVWACKSCNSSKCGRDLLAWMLTKNRFPSILLLRRYLKLVVRYCDAHELMDRDLEDIPSRGLPFDLRLLPHQFPDLADLTLWVLPTDTSIGRRRLR